MTKQKSTKRALLMSGLALLMCVSMLIGSTFAWFTDSVTSGNNIVKSGNLDLKLSYKTYGAENTEWTEVDSDTVVFGEDALYEPGYTEAVWLKVENIGSLAFKYNLALNIVNEKPGTNKDGEEFKLSDYLEVKYMNTSSTDMESEFYTTRESLDSFNFGGVSNSGVATFADDIAVINNGVAFSKNDTAMAGYDSSYVLVVISMPTTVGNEANHNGVDIPEINFTLTAVATQLAYESDSFGSDYDKNADDTVYVSTYEALVAACANGGKIVMTDNIAVEATNIVLENNQSVSLDLNGYTLTAKETPVAENSGNRNSLFFVTDSAALEIKNGTITVESTSEEGDCGTIFAGGSSVLILDNVDCVNNHCVTDKWGAFVYTTGTSRTYVKGGTTFTSTMIDGETSIACAVDTSNWSSAIIMIEEGTVFNGAAPGKDANTEYDFNGWNDYSVYRHIQLEEGCKLVESSEGANDWTVVKDTENYVFVSTAQELADALENVNSNGKNIAITADIDMTGVRFTSPSITNYAGNGTGTFIIDGGYHTVSNMQDMLIAYTGSAKLVEVRRLTLDKANIAVDVEDVTETTGVGAFIGYAGTSTDINIYDCDLTNSTVNGGHWTGGLVGYAAGWSGVDGPVFETLEMKWSSVKNSTITGKGSVGGFIGHATGDAWTKTEIRWYSITGNTVTSTGDSTVKAGSIMGTVGCAGQKTTVTSTDGITATKTGGVDVHRDQGTSNNIVTSNGVANDKVYGRQGSSTGVLYVNGTAVVFE